MGERRSLAQERAAKGLCPNCGEEAAPYRLCKRHREMAMVGRLLRRAEVAGALKAEKRGREKYYSMKSDAAWKAMRQSPIGPELRADDRRRRPRLGRIPVDVERELFGLMLDAGKPVTIEEILAAWGKLRERRKAGSLAGNLSAIIEADRRRQAKNAKRLRIAMPYLPAPVEREGA